MEASVVGLRGSVLETARRMTEERLVVGSEGNVSARVRDMEKMAITPSLVPYKEMKVEDIVVVNFQGEVVAGHRNPSAETKMHAAIYRARPEAGGVVHSHSVYASALAVLHETIPPLIDEQVALLGGEVKVAGYGVPGSEELAKNAAQALEQRDATLLANHGVVCCGKSLSLALRNALLVERLAQTYVIARMTGQPRPLPEESVELQRLVYETTLGET
ncbi:MAG: class II aldolase/adducin family protein [Candidatus Geothermarchaeales archaeon]